MTDCIIKTKDLSMDTCKILLQVLKARLSIEGAEIAEWEHKNTHTNEELDEMALDEMRMQKEALRREAMRLAESMR